MFNTCCGSQPLTVDEFRASQICALTPPHVRSCFQTRSGLQDIGAAATAQGDWIISSEARDAPTSESWECLTSIAATEASPQQFWVSVEKTGVVKWGIDIEWRNRKNLRIVCVKEGVISRWNLDHPDMPVESEDMIVEINGHVDDTEKLVKEISTASRLVMRVQKKHNCRIFKRSWTDRSSATHNCFLEQPTPSRVQLPQYACFEEFQPLDVFNGYKVYDINFHDSSSLVGTLSQYYKCCAKFSGLMMTTSCESMWNAAGRINRAAKVVPAVPCNEDVVRIFVFDDKMNLHQGGSEDSRGCCNLRDVHTGEFVDFSIDSNGFSCEKLFGHTLVHHSSKYNNILVQVSILDAMANPDYFTDIVKRFSGPTDSLLVYTDIFGTVIWDKIVDTATCYDFGLPEILLCSMFRCVEVRPHTEHTEGSVSFRWKSQPEVHIVEAESLLSLVKRALHQDDSLYQQFWTFKTCKQFLEAVSSGSDIAWQEQKTKITINQFFTAYSEYLDEMRRSGAGASIAGSWLRCHGLLTEAGHSVVINSFSPQAQRFLRHLVSEPTLVPQLMVNYSLWEQEERDILDVCFAR